MEMMAYEEGMRGKGKGGREKEKRQGYRKE